MRILYNFFCNLGFFNKSSISLILLLLEFIALAIISSELNLLALPPTTSNFPFFLDLINLSGISSLIIFWLGSMKYLLKRN